MHMHWAQLFHQIYVARWTLFGGLVTTLEISVLVIIIGTIAGLLVGLGLCFGHITVRLALRFYVDLIRGVPSLVLIFFSFYGTSLLGLDISSFAAGVFALAGFATAHIGELTRGAIQSIPHAQMDAAKSIGLGFWGRLIYAILPQALRRMLPALTNRGIEIFKMTTLASAIAYVELLQQGKLLASLNFNPIETYTVIAVVFFVCLLPLVQATYALERRLGRSDA